MGVPVILTPQAQEDLAGIVRFIALANPEETEQAIQAEEAAASRLAPRDTVA